MSKDAEFHGEFENEVLLTYEGIDIQELKLS